jgi:hypothetical protein
MKSNRCKMPQHDSDISTCPFDIMSRDRKPAYLSECGYYHSGMHCPEYDSILDVRQNNLRRAQKRATPQKTGLINKFVSASRRRLGL